MTNLKSSEKIVGVVTPNQRLFDLWVNDIGKQKYGNNHKFVLLREIHDVKGRQYVAVENGYKFQDVSADVYNSALIRIR